MGQNRKLPIMIVFLTFLLLILDSRTALESCAQGIELCLTTVIPSLFPFMVLGIFLFELLAGRMNGTASILILGFLGGYPTGAQAVSLAYEKKRLCREDAEQLLSFCSNAGPAFIFGIGGTIFPHPWICGLVWLIHILSALLVRSVTAGRNVQLRPVNGEQRSLSQVMERSLRSMALVCGWVVIFRVLIAFLERWCLWLLGSNLQLLFIGLLELSNGSCDLTDISSVGLRMELFSLFLGYGGTCVYLQTRSILSRAGLNGSGYLPGKLAQASAGYLLSVLAQFLLPPGMRYWPNWYCLTIPAGVFCGYALFSFRRQIFGRNSVALGV